MHHPLKFRANYEGHPTKSTDYPSKKRLVFIELTMRPPALLRRNELLGRGEVHGNQF